MLVGRSPANIVLNTAKKDTLLADLVARIGTLTDEEIANVPRMKYIKEGLWDLRHQEQRQNKRTVNQQMALDMEPYIVDSFTPNPMGVMARYTGFDSYIRFGNSEMLVNSGDLVWFSENGGVWLDTVYSAVADRRLTIAVMEECSMTHYKDTLCRARNNLKVTTFKNPDPNVVKETSLYTIRRI